MGKILLSLVIFVLMSSLAFAQGQQLTQDLGAGQGNQTAIQAEAQNLGETAQIQTQERVRVQTGTYTAENGQQMQIQTQSNNQIQLKSGIATAQTAMQMTQQQTQEGTNLQVQLSNGKNAEIKVMPDKASEKALEMLRLRVCSAENECTIELKEVGSGEQAKAVYELKTQREAKVLGLFRAKMQVQAQVDAENGEVIQTKKSWWAFLATEPAE